MERGLLFHDANRRSRGKQSQNDIFIETHLQPPARPWFCSTSAQSFSPAPYRCSHNHSDIQRISRLSLWVKIIVSRLKSRNKAVTSCIVSMWHLRPRLFLPRGKSDYLFMRCLFTASFRSSASQVDFFYRSLASSSSRSLLCRLTCVHALCHVKSGLMPPPLHYSEPLPARCSTEPASMGVDKGSSVR